MDFDQTELANNPLYTCQSLQPSYDSGGCVYESIVVPKTEKNYDFYFHNQDSSFIKDPITHIDDDKFNEHTLNSAIKNQNDIEFDFNQNEVKNNESYSACENKSFAWQISGNEAFNHFMNLNKQASGFQNNFYMQNPSVYQNYQNFNNTNYSNRHEIENLPEEKMQKIYSNSSINQDTYDPYNYEDSSSQLLVESNKNQVHRRKQTYCNIKNDSLPELWDNNKKLSYNQNSFVNKMENFKVQKEKNVKRAKSKLVSVLKKNENKVSKKTKNICKITKNKLMPVKKHNPKSTPENVNTNINYNVIGQDLISTTNFVNESNSMEISSHNNIPNRSSSHVLGHEFMNNTKILNINNNSMDISSSDDIPNMSNSHNVIGNDFTNTTKIINNNDNSMNVSSSNDIYNISNSQNPVQNSDLSSADYFNYVQPFDKIIQSDLDKLVSPIWEGEFSEIISSFEIDDSQNKNVNSFKDHQANNQEIENNHLSTKKINETEYNLTIQKLIEKRIFAQSNLTPQDLMEILLFEKFNLTPQEIIEKILSAQPNLKPEEFVAKRLKLQNVFAKKYCYPHFFNISNDAVVNEILYNDTQLLNINLIDSNFIEMNCFQGQFLKQTSKLISSTILESLYDMKNLEQFSEINTELDGKKMIDYFEHNDNASLNMENDNENPFNQIYYNHGYDCNFSKSSTLVDVPWNYNTAKYFPQFYNDDCKKGELILKIKRIDETNDNYMIEKQAMKNVEGYNCTDCSETFRTKQLLKNHVSQNHNGPYDSECDICHVRSKKNSAHKKHDLSCPRTKNYNCPKCAKLYRYPAALDKHLQNHH